MSYNSLKLAVIVIILEICGDPAVGTGEGEGEAAAGGDCAVIAGYSNFGIINLGSIGRK